MIDALPLLLSDEGYLISRSVRLRSSATAYFSRTPASTTNRRTFTWSGWVKRGTLGAADSNIFGASSDNFASNYFSIYFGAGNGIRIQNVTAGAANFDCSTTAVYRDPSAWYHVVAAIDTTQATSTERLKLWVNGSQVTAFSPSTYPSLNFDTFVDSSSFAHALGRLSFDGYLTEINFIDGQALTPSSFGETNPVTGVWQPKKYTGTYGTNGFYLNFSDPSAATATTIGKDSSGNGNNWTPNNISVTAGATYDSMIDVPTPWPDGGNGRGNYAVLNPLKTTTAPTQGNLALLGTSGSFVDSVYGSIGVTGSGKYYFEVNGGYIVGVNFIDANPATNQTNGRVVYHGASGQIFDGASAIQTGLATVISTDIVSVALNLDAGTLAFYKNNVQVGTNVTINATNTWWPFLQNANTYTSFANFGQRPFAYTPPSGFKALNTQNLPVTTILKGNQYFDATRYTGNGTSISSTQNVTGLSHQPDLVWIKDRTNGINNSWSHYLVDSVRGINSNGSAYLASNETSAEVAANSGFGITALNNDGFSLKGNGTLTNTNGDAYVAWTWKEGATQGFDIVTYTGNGANRTIAHNLGVAPSMVIVKRRDSTGNWQVRHTSIAAANSIQLNLTSAAAAAATVWNSTAPTSTVFSIGTSTDVNANTGTYVAYLFAEVAGFSRFGSYTGNGSADGPFVFTNFRPRWVLVKRTDSTSNWSLYDTSRNAFNVADSPLYPDLSNAEGSATLGIDIVSNGFKVRHTVGAYNASGGTYIYAAFSEVGFKYALGR